MLPSIVVIENDGKMNIFPLIAVTGIHYTPPKDMYHIGVLTVSTTSIVHHYASYMPSREALASGEFRVRAVIYDIPGDKEEKTKVRI